MHHLKPIIRDSKPFSKMSRITVIPSSPKSQFPCDVPGQTFDYYEFYFNFYNPDFIPTPSKFLIESVDMFDKPVTQLQTSKSKKFKYLSP
jgi:hypothetical protein